MSSPFGMLAAPEVLSERLQRQNRSDDANIAAATTRSMPLLGRWAALSVITALWAKLTMRRKRCRCDGLIGYGYHQQENSNCDIKDEHH